MPDKAIYFFIGTTAEFIKLTPIFRELKNRSVSFQIITSGQTIIQFEDLRKYTGGLKVNISLSKKPKKSSVPHFFYWFLKAFFLGFFQLRREFKGKNNHNCFFIVHGDTISALMGSLFARIFRVKLVHVEAGLRSYNFLEPFPEEICKTIINYLSSINFCPNDWSVRNLQNLKSENVNTHQNTVIEPHWWAIKEKKGLQYAKQFKKYYILSMHRQEHIYFNKEWTRDMLNFVINNAPANLNCLFIMHPLTSRFLQSEKLDVDEVHRQRLFMIPKMQYSEFITLLANAEFIATDGCTNEEEAYYLGLPLLSLRNLTERIEGKDANVVISKGDKIIIRNFLNNYKKYKRKPVRIEKRPSKIIVDYLLHRE